MIPIDKFKVNDTGDAYEITTVTNFDDVELTEPVFKIHYNYISKEEAYEVLLLFRNRLETIYPETSIEYSIPVEEES